MKKKLEIITFSYLPISLNSNFNLKSFSNRELCEFNVPIISKWNVSRVGNEVVNHPFNGEFLPKDRFLFEKKRKQPMADALLSSIVVAVSFGLRSVFISSVFVSFWLDVRNVFVNCRSEWWYDTFHLGKTFIGITQAHKSHQLNNHLNTKMMFLRIYLRLFNALRASITWTHCSGQLSSHVIFHLPPSPLLLFVHRHLVFPILLLSLPQFISIVAAKPFLPGRDSRWQLTQNNKQWTNPISDAYEICYEANRMLNA